MFATLEDVGIIPKRLRESVFGHLYTMLAVVVGFTIFRADSLGAAWVMIKSMFTGFTFIPANTLTLISLLDARTACFLITAVLLASGLPQQAVRRLSEGTGLSQGGRALAYGVLFILCVLNLSKATFNPFIYFQF